MKKLLVPYCVLSIGMLSGAQVFYDEIKVKMNSQLAAENLITEKKVIDSDTFVWIHGRIQDFLGRLGKPVHGLPGTLPQIGFLNGTESFPIRQIIAVIGTPPLSTVEMIKPQLDRAYKAYVIRERESLKKHKGRDLRDDELSAYTQLYYFLKYGDIITQYIMYGEFKSTSTAQEPSNVDYGNQHVLYYPYMFSQLTKDVDEKQVVIGLFNADGLISKDIDFVKAVWGLKNPGYLPFSKFTDKLIDFDKKPEPTNQDTKIIQDSRRSVAYFWTVAFNAPFLKEFDKDPRYPKVMMVTCHLLTSMDIDKLDKFSAQQTLKDFLAYMKKPGQNDDEKAANKFVANIKKTFDYYAQMYKEEEQKEKIDKQRRKRMQKAQEKLAAKEEKDKQERERIRKAKEEKDKQERERKAKEEKDKQERERIRKAKEEKDKQERERIRKAKEEKLAVKEKQEKEQSLQDAKDKYDELLKALKTYKEFLHKIPKSA